MKTPVTISLLDTIEIAAPCNARWEDMNGDERKRHCAECNLNVFNLSSMTRDEAEDLIATSEGRLCVRLYKRADGTVLTQDCPTGLRALRQRTVRSIRNIAATVVGLAAGMIGLGTRQAWAQGEMIMGGMRAPTSDLRDSKFLSDTTATEQDENANKTVKECLPIHDTAWKRIETPAIEEPKARFILGEISIVERTEPTVPDTTPVTEPVETPTAGPVRTPVDGLKVDRSDIE